MDVADFINLNGEKKGINATEYKKEVHYGRLSCSRCNEKVDWINGQEICKNGEPRKKYFKHHHGTKKIECENYCSNTAQNRYMSPCESVGLPLYLLEEFNSFTLNVGLYGISENTLNEAKESNLSVQVLANNSIVGTKKIDNVNIEPERMHYVKIDVCSNAYKLELISDHIPYEINEKWHKNVNGIEKDGAIFEYSQYGGKKVKSTEGLITNTDYYYLLRNNFINYNDYPSITFEEIGEIIFNNSKKYLLFKINIKERNKDSLSFCQKFGMALSYSAPQLVPLWPPCKVNDQELIFIAQEKKFFILKSDDKAKQIVYSQESQGMVDSQSLSENKLILRSKVSSKEYLSIGNPVSPFTYVLLSKKINSNRRAIALASQDISDSVLQIDSSAKVRIVRFKGHLPSNITIEKQKLIDIEKPRRNEHIEILHGLDRLLIIKKEKKEISGNVERIDEYLFRMLSCTNTNLILVPVSLRWIMLELKHCIKTYHQLQKILQNGKISQNALHILKQQCLRNRGI